MAINIVKYPMDKALTFSMYLSRFVAARRPHAFKLNAHRTKLALIVIAVDAMTFITVTSVAM